MAVYAFQSAEPMVPAMAPHFDSPTPRKFRIVRFFFHAEAFLLDKPEAGRAYEMSKISDGVVMRMVVF